MASGATAWRSGFRSPLPPRTGITLNTVVELTPRGEQLVVSVLKRPGAELDDLLAGVTEDNLHGEIETDSPVGGEVW